MCCKSDEIRDWNSGCKYGMGYEYTAEHTCTRRTETYDYVNQGKGCHDKCGEGKCTGRGFNRKKTLA